MRYTCHFDGSYRNHEGKEDMGIGCVILDENGRIAFELSLHLDREGSTNYAEYCACIEVLKWLTVNEHEKAIVNGDSKLVVNQLNGIWRVRKGLYTDKANEAKELFKNLPNVEIVWGRRHKNKEADGLSKMGLNGDNYIIQS
jgi:ribonuclease HI